jgi:hypothetical protein
MTAISSDAVGMIDAQRPSKTVWKTTYLSGYKRMLFIGYQRWARPCCCDQSLQALSSCWADFKSRPLRLMWSISSTHVGLLSLDAASAGALLSAQSGFSGTAIGTSFVEIASADARF